jgi:uncharacterized protein YtpQ (UPF0354 family)
MHVRLFCALLLVSAATCGSARAQDVPKGEAAFTDYVAGQMRRELKGAKVEVKGPLTLAVDDLQANLDRIYAYCNKDAQGCRHTISNYVKSIVQVRNSQGVPLSKDAVRIVVRTSAYVKAAAAQKAKVLPRPLAGELVMLPALDTPRMIRILAEKDNQEFGLSSDEVFKLGLVNLRAQLKPLMQVAKVAQAGQIGYLNGDAYHSSRLALHESWSPLAKAQGGKLIVAAPATDTVLYIGDDTALAIDAFRTLVKTVLSRSPSPLSGELLRWTPERWEVVR